MRFLIDSLHDLHEQLQNLPIPNGRLYIFQGNPVHIFRQLNQNFKVQKICFEQDCEPIWNARDNDVKQLCQQLDIEYVELVSHTLWDPRLVIETNGGIPPLTYQMFLVSTTSILFEV